LEKGVTLGAMVRWRDIEDDDGSTPRHPCSRRDRACRALPDPIAGTVAAASRMPIRGGMPGSHDLRDARSVVANPARVSSRPPISSRRADDRA